MATNIFGWLFGHEVLKNLVGTVVQNIGDKTIAEVDKKLPLFLGLSLEDERVWAGFLIELGEEKTIILTNFLNSLADYERNHFRHVVVGIEKMKSSETRIISETKDKNGKMVATEKEAKIMYSGGPVAFLDFLIKIITAKGNDEAKRICMAGNIIGDTFFQEVINKWKDGVAWFRGTGMSKCIDTLKSFFGVNNLSEITPERVVEKVKNLDARVVSMIPEPPENRGFIHDAFGWMIGRKK
jgi:hypothetical protein